ncbi:(deoxy)nucleoside triphosphate pyrophosphohydrolase [Pontixanthobacter luteolus]
MENIPTWTLVVAGALHDREGRFLMHKRPEKKHHGGLWEFPGGKVETGECPADALVRELAEELGVTIKPEDCVANCFADSTQTDADFPIVILLYTIAEWGGVPAALEGGAIDWFMPDEIAKLQKPPLDIELAGQLF